MNTIFDISSPDKSLQDKVFRDLIGSDTLNENPVQALEFKDSMNRFAVYGDIQSKLVSAVRLIDTYANPITISNGLFSTPYILVDSWDSHDALDAFISLKRDLIRGIKVVYLHFRSDHNHDQGRRGSLSLFHQSIRPPQELWHTFESFDKDKVIKTILQCMKVTD